MVILSTQETFMTKKTVKKTNHFKDLALLFSVPLGIALLASAAIYIPRHFANPSYDFVYSVCSDYDCSSNFDVDSDGKVAKTEAKESFGPAAKLYVFSVKDDSSKRLTLEQAQQYKLDTASKSPDNYKMTGGSGDSGLFLGESDPSWYLSDGLKKKELDIYGSNIYDPNSVRFLGWVTK